MARLVAAALVMVGASGQAWAQQQPPPSPLTLEAAIEYAVDHFPTVRAALEQVNASTAGVDVARTAFLPRLDSLWQSNVATVNNVFGQVLPQSILPALTGPVLSSTSGQGVWGSAAGALLSWEALDFGLRHAQVTSAEATVRRARAAEALTRLDVQTAVGAAFLAVVAAERAVSAAQADLDRRDVLVRTVHTLVDNQLRPGADASRADAERAAAQTRLILARQSLSLAHVTMTRVLGGEGQVALDSRGLLDRVPAGEIAATTAASHPLAQARRAAVDLAQAQRNALSRTDWPRVFVQSSVFARGTGADASGLLSSNLGGLGLERTNWAAGVQVVLPNLFDFSSLRARKVAADASERAESALYDEAVLTVSSQRQEAAALLEAARAIAANTPVQRAAAQQSEAQARARYQAGLASLVEVAEAQSLLAQAEAQDQLARIDVWRALLADAVAQGTLAPFLDLARSASEGR